MRSYLHIIPITIIFICISCRDNLDYALELAGDNKEELLKVLDHFKNDPDSLKYGAARFLIENMAYHHTWGGKGVNSVDSAYLAMSEYPKEQREKIFKNLTKENNALTDSLTIDIKTVRADYLIKAIDEACELWHEVAWNKDYNTSLFYNYVLPYRILDEPLSDWKNTIKQVFPLLHKNKVFSTRGWQMEAELLELKDCCIKDDEMASQQKLVLLDRKGSNISFYLPSVTDCSKNLVLRYYATKNQTKLCVNVNGLYADTIHLAPTNDTKTFRMSKSGYILCLRKGLNKVDFSFAGDTIGLDYIQLGGIEDCKEKELEDFSHNFCMIKNVQNGYCITFDTLRSSLLNQIEVKPPLENDSLQLVRMDYCGRSSWKISAFKTDTTDLCMEVQYASTEPDSPISQYHYIKGNNQKWIVLPLNNGFSRIMSKDTGLFLDVKKEDITGKTVLVQNPYNGNKSQLWKIEKKGRNPNVHSKYEMGSVYSEALRVHEVMGQFEWTYFSSGFAPKASSLLSARTGNCRDEASYTVFLCRSLGIPATIDFTPHWGNRSWGHHWSVLLKPNGTSVPFYMGSEPGDTAQFFHPYVKTKVFRRCFQLNRQITNDMKGEKSIPRLFQTPDWTDVTEEYCPTTNVTRNVPEEYNERRIAYICIFDNNDWLPVYYGVVRNGKVTFPKMGRRVMYISAFFEDGRLVPFGTPFCIEKDGTIRNIKVDQKKKCTLRLTRKYPYFSAEDPINTRMRNGRFQGANKSSFSGATDLYCFNEVTNGGWYEVPISDKQKYRYLRYYSPDGSYGNINELWFFDENGDTIKGEVIGTDGNNSKDKDKVFDNNILTGFEGKFPNENWVGLHLKIPRRVKTIRFIPRNDGNCIEIGDKYELKLWTNTNWKVLATVKAKADIMRLKNVPSNGLYVLKDLTKGNEQRIFTYEDRKQVWW